MLKSTKLNRFFIFGEHNVIAANPLQSMRLVSRYVALTPGKLRHICVSFLDLIELYKTSFTRSYLVFIMVRKKKYSSADGVLFVMFGFPHELETYS